MIQGDVLLSDSDISLAGFVSDTPSLSDEALLRYDTFMQNNAIEEEVTKEDELSRTVKGIKNRMTRLIAA